MMHPGANMSNLVIEQQEEANHQAHRLSFSNKSPKLLLTQPICIFKNIISQLIACAKYK